MRLLTVLLYATAFFFALFVHWFQLRQEHSARCAIYSTERMRCVPFDAKAEIGAMLRCTLQRDTGAGYGCTWSPCRDEPIGLAYLRCAEDVSRFRAVLSLWWSPHDAECHAGRRDRLPDCIAVFNHTVKLIVLTVVASLVGVLFGVFICMQPAAPIRNGAIVADLGAAR
jgi:hypothetical protein